jgi:hypothetical protein
MNIPDLMWIALFFLASGVLGVLIGRTEKKSEREKNRILQKHSRSY